MLLQISRSYRTLSGLYAAFLLLLRIAHWSRSLPQNQHSWQWCMPKPRVSPLPWLGLEGFGLTRHDNDDVWLWMSTGKAAGSAGQDWVVLGRWSWCGRGLRPVPGAGGVTGLGVPTGASQVWRLRVGQAVVQARLSYVSRGWSPGAFLPYAHLNPNSTASCPNYF